MNTNTRPDTDSIIRTHAFVECNIDGICRICLADVNHPAHAAARGAVSWGTYDTPEAANEAALEMLRWTR